MDHGPEELGVSNQIDPQIEDATMIGCGDIEHISKDPSVIELINKINERATEQLKNIMGISVDPDDAVIQEVTENVLCSGTTSIEINGEKEVKPLDIFWPNFEFNGENQIHIKVTLGKTYRKPLRPYESFEVSTHISVPLKPNANLGDIKAANKVLSDLEDEIIRDEVTKVMNKLNPSAKIE